MSDTASTGDPAAPAGTGAQADTAAATAARAFARHFGERPAGVWAAPGRVNLIGEHTDYNDGFVMPLALPHATAAAVAPRDDGLLTVVSEGLGEQNPNGVPDLPVAALDPAAPVAGWRAYPAGVAWALREAGHAVGGARIALGSTVPTGAGLSSSAALEVAVALALNELYGLGLGRAELAAVCRRAENAYVGVPCGIMDQMATACCTAGHVLHLDTRDLTARQVPFDLAADGLRLLVVDTRVQHALADGAYAERRAGCAEAAAALGVDSLRAVDPAGLPVALDRLSQPRLRRLTRHVVTENERVARTVALLEGGHPREIGPVLSAGHVSLRDDYAVSCPELDLAVDAAERAGALGARMTGGGFGGSAVVLVEAETAPGVADAVTDAFAGAGHTAPRVFTAIPGPGARRLSAPTTDA